MEPIRITYTPTREDYRLANKELAFAHGKNPFSSYLFIFAIVIPGLVLPYFYTSSAPSSWIEIYHQFSIMFIALAVVWFCMGMLNIFNPQYLTNDVYPDPLFFVPITIELAEEGYIVNSATGESKTFWNTLISYKETKNFLFLKFAGRIQKYFTLPKHAFVSDEQKRAFLEYLTTKLGSRKNDIINF